MSSFTCLCGGVTHESHEAPDASGVGLGLEKSAVLEANQACTSAAFFATTNEERGTWLASHLGSQYPTDASNEEVVEDLISSSFLASKFVSIFECPHCGRIAIARAPTRDVWRFYSPDEING